MKYDLYALIAQGEHQQQDFKFEISDARKIARTLSAFSNTDGGRLLIGVKDNGRIAGIRTEEEAYMVEAAARMYCKPPVEVEFATYTAEGRAVLIAEVPCAPQQPVCAVDADGKSWAYLRVADENVLATPVHLQVWRLGKSPKGILLQYEAHAQQLLALLTSEGPLTVNRCSKLTRFSRKRVERLLAQLICLSVVEWGYDGQRFLYRTV